MNDVDRFFFPLHSKILKQIYHKKRKVELLLCSGFFNLYSTGVSLIFPCTTIAMFENNTNTINNNKIDMLYFIKP